VNRFVRSGLSAAAAVLAIAVAPSADAQQFYNGRQGDIVFVAPNGDILDYVPSGAAYARDRRGNRVLVDPYGNVIATEMRARGYYPRPPVRDAYNNDAYYGDDPYGDSRYSERGAVTARSRVTLRSTDSPWTSSLTRKAAKTTLPSSRTSKCRRWRSRSRLRSR